MAKGAYFSKPYPLFLVSGEGCYVTTLDGQLLLDGANHHTAGVLGHRHPAVMEAVREQLERGVALGGPTTVEYELAQEMTERVPSLERVRFTGSGGEAAQNVLRLVRGWTGRQKIAKFEGAFHGRVDALEISVSPPLDQAGAHAAPQAVPQGRGFVRGAAEDTVILPYNRPEAVARLLERHRDELAAVWLDPRAGILDADREFIRYMRRDYGGTRPAAGDGRGGGVPGRAGWVARTVRHPARPNHVRQDHRGRLSDWARSGGGPS